MHIIVVNYVPPFITGHQWVVPPDSHWRLSEWNQRGLQNYWINVTSNIIRILLLCLLCVCVCACECVWVWVYMWVFVCVCVNVGYCSCTAFIMETSQIMLQTFTGSSCALDGIIGWVGSDAVVCCGIILAEWIYIRFKHSLRNNVVEAHCYVVDKDELILSWVYTSLQCVSLVRGDLILQVVRQLSVATCGFWVSIVPIDIGRAHCHLASIHIQCYVICMLLGMLITCRHARMRGRPATGITLIDELGESDI